MNKFLILLIALAAMMQFAAGAEDKDKGYYPEPPYDFHLYSDGSNNVYFNLDKHCEKLPFCIGAVLPFKDFLYYDKHFDHKAGYIAGYSKIVGYHEEYLEMYCVFSLILIDKYGNEYAELALAGNAKLHGEANSFLITAFDGLYKDETGGYVTALPLDEGATSFLYTVDFH